MSESKHTPGPWEARTFLVLGGADLRDRICHVGTSTSLGPSRSQESEANARLIAAAPELLEAARELSDRYPLDPQLTRLQLAILAAEPQS